MPATPPQGLPGTVQHDPQPGQLLVAGAPASHRIGAADRKVDRDHQLAVTDHHDQQQAIDAEADAMFLPTVPGADQAQLLARLLEDAVIGHPGPLPATAGGRAFVRHMLPQPRQQPPAELLQALDPLPFRQGPQQPRGPVLVPPAHPTQLRDGATAKKGGNITPKILPSSLPWAWSRHSTSSTTVSGRPNSRKACSKAWRERWARACSRWSRSRAFWRRHCLAFCCCLWYRLAWVMGCSSVSLLHLVLGLEETMTFFLCGFKHFHGPSAATPHQRPVHERNGKVSSNG